MQRAARSLAGEPLRVRNSLELFLPVRCGGEEEIPVLEWFCQRI